MSQFKKIFIIVLSICIGKSSFAQFSTTPGNIIQQSAGSVAIGFPSYSTPTTTLLQVKNGSVLFDGGIGTTPMSGAGPRMMWIPAKKAFRAGMTTATQWDDANIGNYSAAFGINTKATGSSSFAAGSTAYATGGQSFAINANTTASGMNSFSGGSGTTASADYSFAVGFGTVSQSSYSFVIGKHNLNPGTYSTNTWISTDPLFVIGNGTSTTARNNALTVLKNGNVLIDKATQVNSTYKLDVNGKMRALEIVVNTTGADFVFEKDYELMPLNVLEQKIKADKHLPEIASAAEMQENGVGLGELNIKLLQKTEELTLYIIELNKRIEELEKK